LLCRSYFGTAILGSGGPNGQPERTQNQDASLQTSR
jgi:hypothetical protein